MKVLILYRERSEYARRVDEFVHDFKRQYPDAPLEVQDVDTREGAATASLYDMATHPLILALQDDGRMIQSWEATEHMPLMQEVAYYAIT
jgi:hypothetical protein